MTTRTRRVPKRWLRNPSDLRAVELGYEFDSAAAERPITFIERFCKQSKGKWAGLPLVLLDWQRDFLRRLYGWKAPDGRRRFRSAYLEVPKKNGKSTLLSGLGLFSLLADGEGAPEVYVNAVDREQASIIYEEAGRMVEKSPDLKARLEVIPSKKRIVDPIGLGKLVANSADVPSKDGVNASHVIFDELHRQKDRDMWSVFEFAGASREQPLRISITTAGEAEEGVWYEQRLYSLGVNDGTIPDVSHLGVIFAADPDDDLDDPRVWHRVNPSLGETIRLDTFKAEWEEAKASPSPVKRQNFKRLRFGLVSGGAASFLELTSWDACAGNLSPRELEEQSRTSDAFAWVGLDLSVVNDLTAAVLVVGDEEEGFDVIPRFFLPRGNVVELEREHKLPYREWADEGLVILTDGETIDYARVKVEVLALLADRNIAGVISDPYNAHKLAVELKEQERIPVQYLRQGFASLSGPTKELLRLVKSRKLRHGGHPILRNHIANAAVETDVNANLRLHKGRSRGKIDGAAALVNALAGPFGPEEPAERSVYEERGVLTLG